MTGGRRHVFGQAPRVVRRRRPTGDGAEQTRVIHLLKSAAQILAGEVTPADEEHRSVGEPRVGDSGERIGHARSCGDDGDAEPAGEPGVCVGGVCRSLLMTHVDDSDPLLDAAVDDGKHVTTGEHEHRVDALRLQRACNRLACLDLRHHHLLVDAGADCAQPAASGQGVAGCESGGTLHVVSTRFLLGFVALALVAGACAVDARVEAAVSPSTSPAAATTTVAAVSTAAPTTSPPPTMTIPTTTIPTTTTLAPRPTIVLGFAGDTSFTHGLHDRDPLGDITAELSAPDLMFVNLETTIAESGVGTRVNKTYTFKSPPVSVDLLADAGIDVLQLANNHILDFQRPALLRTLELLDSADLPYAGAGTNPAAAYEPRYLEVDGWTIGFVALNRVPCSWAVSDDNTRPEVAWTCDPFIIDGMAAVQEASLNSDLVIVMVHWGIELDHCPQSYQRDLAEAWASVGADLIIGGHPHVLQGVERIGDAWLVNSTGNFAFPSARQASARSAMFEFTVGEDEISLRAIPVRITAGRPGPASGDDAAAILGDLSRWSFGYTFDEGGMAVATEEPGACG